MINSESAPAHRNMLHKYRTFLDAENIFPHRLLVCPLVFFFNYYFQRMKSQLRGRLFLDSRKFSDDRPKSDYTRRKSYTVVLPVVLKRLDTLRELRMGLPCTGHWRPIKTVSAIFRYRLRRRTLRDRLVWQGVSVVWSNWGITSQLLMLFQLEGSWSDTKEWRTR
jgi:hypothetical protein